MPSREELKRKVFEEIDSHAAEIINLSQTILNHPEPGFREVKTSQLVAGKFAEPSPRALEMVEHAVALGGGARSHRLLAEMRLLSPFPELRSPVDALASARAAVMIDPGDPDNLAVLAQALALTHAYLADRGFANVMDALPAMPRNHVHLDGVFGFLSFDPGKGFRRVTDAERQSQLAAESEVCHGE
jgi:hypothetical protein